MFFNRTEGEKAKEYIFNHQVWELDTRYSKKQNTYQDNAALEAAKKDNNLGVVPPQGPIVYNMTFGWINLSTRPLQSIDLKFRIGIF